MLSKLYFNLLYCVLFKNNERRAVCYGYLNRVNCYKISVLS